MSFDKKQLPGWKAARLAMTELTVEQMDDICLVIDQAYSIGVEHMLVKATEANNQALKQRLIDVAIAEAKNE